MRICSLDLQSPARDLAVAVGALVPTALTFVLIEDPIRRRRPWPFSSPWQTIAAGIGLSLALAGLALVLLLQAEATRRRNPWPGAIAAAERARAPCGLQQGFSHLPPADDCLVGAANAPPRLLVWGDSHALHFVEMIRIHATHSGYSAVAWTNDGCPPVFSGAPHDCLRFNAAVARELPRLASRGVTGIFLGSRQLGFAPSSTDTELRMGEARFRAVLQAAQAAGMRVLVAAPVPEFRLPLPRCLAHATPARCGRSRAELEQARAAFIASVRRTIAEFDNVRLWDPWPALCSETVCTPVRDGVILYADRGHLSVAGSRALVPSATAEMSWLLR